ncbi:MULTISPECIES: DUF6745 domain-containing protein [unclassified Nostoc]|uniref:DUF6745 domain-containing protein n=1 Tax=unclassified Nostoc TaxID=2593658 RepID=UPI000B950EDF|nr:hypothetical protein [Nostoc sp. 'Peltigera membranacea cyanobiont' 232]
MLNHFVALHWCACGWTFFFQDFCFTCQRPHKVLLDEQNRPHAENESAIEFLDGFSVFAKNGMLAFDGSEYKIFT